MNIKGPAVIVFTIFKSGTTIAIKNVRSLATLSHNYEIKV